METKALVEVVKGKPRVLLETDPDNFVPVEQYIKWREGKEKSVEEVKKIGKKEKVKAFLKKVLEKKQTAKAEAAQKKAEENYQREIDFGFQPIKFKGKSYYLGHEGALYERREDNRAGNLAGYFSEKPIPTIYETKEEWKEKTTETSHNEIPIGKKNAITVPGAVLIKLIENDKDTSDSSKKRAKERYEVSTLYKVYKTKRKLIIEQLPTTWETEMNSLDDELRSSLRRHLEENPQILAQFANLFPSKKSKK